MKRMLTRKPFGKMTGLTLLETMFAIAIGALVLIGAVIFYMSTKQNANANKSVGDMNAIVAAYEAYITGGNVLSTGTTIATLQGGGYLPTPLNTAWGQPYVALAATSPASVTITVAGIAGTAASTPDANCKAIASLAGATGTSSTVADNSTATDCKFTYPL